LVLGLAAVPVSAWAQGMGLGELISDHSPLLLLHASSSQGYLGVDLADIDGDKAQALKLKEVRGAVITLIDHDAPAGKIGLKVNDVVIQVNGQNVEGAEQLRRMLREIPAGRRVSLEISRDGNIQTLAVELADRRAMEKQVWKNFDNDSVGVGQAAGMGIFGTGGDGSLPGGFRMPIFGSTLNVGATLEPLTGQTAELLGVRSGLWVSKVVPKSEAAAAGLARHDVILKVGTDAVTTLSDWDRALRANQGKPVQVTVLRDKKQQTLTLQVDSKHKQGAVAPGGMGLLECPLEAEVDPELLKGFVWDAEEAARQMQEQAEAMKEQLKAGGLEQFGLDKFGLSPAQVEAFRKQAEAMKDKLAAEDFKIDPKQMEEMKRQMEEFRKSLKAEELKLAPQ
jgi:membrane-associated protease RseP (regulator of RpoE activity)